MLKRSNPISNLTAIPLDTPLESNLTIRFLYQQEKDAPPVLFPDNQMLRLKMDSFCTVYKLKWSIEPYGYAHYINLIDIIDKNAYFKRLSSPTSPRSDYESEPGSPGADSLEVFVQALELKSNQQEMLNHQQIFKYNVDCQTIDCIIHLWKLIE